MCAWELRAYKPENETDLFICVPHTGWVKVDWAFKFKNLDMPPGVHFELSGNQGQPINTARNLAVSYAFQHKAKHLFFLDSDVEITRDALVKLYGTRRPIVAGVYCQRAPPYGLSANINKRMLSIELLNKYPDRLVDVHEIGMGCCLIDMRVFKKIAEKDNLQWRCMQLHAKELGVQVPPDVTSPKEVAQFHNEDAINLDYKCGFCGKTLIAEFFKYTIATEASSIEGPYSEDYYFCYKARKYGFPISVHTGVFGEHELTSVKITRGGLTNTVESAWEV